MSTTEKVRVNANEKYQQFNGTDHYYKHWLPGITYTDGVAQVAEDYGAHWFLDVIASYQGGAKFKAERFQVWKLSRVKGDEFLVTATDGDKNVIGKQKIGFSDFKDDDLTVWFVDRIMLLPSEY